MTFLLFSDCCGVALFQISKNRRVTVRSFGGRIMVDIREFYVKDGKQMPGRKGSYLFSFCCQSFGFGICVFSSFRFCCFIPFVFAIWARLVT